MAPPKKVVILVPIIIPNLIMLCYIVYTNLGLYMITYYHITIGKVAEMIL